MIIAFDFDGVLSSIKIQALAKKSIKEGNEIWVITARRENDFNKNILNPILQRIKLSEYRVIYADEKPKIEHLKTINADLYIDNNSKEFQHINNFTNTIPVLYYE